MSDISTPDPRNPNNPECQLQTGIEPPSRNMAEAGEDIEVGVDTESTHKGLLGPKNNYIRDCIIQIASSRNRVLPLAFLHPMAHRPHTHRRRGL